MGRYSCEKRKYIFYINVKDLILCNKIYPHVNLMYRTCNYI